jgi:hypothetical protein
MPREEEIYHPDDASAHEHGRTAMEPGIDPFESEFQGVCSGESNEGVNVRHLET